MSCQNTDPHEGHDHDVNPEEEVKNMTLTADDLEESLYAFPDLPYAADALEPYIDAHIMELHYDKHHKGYFKKFLAAVEGKDINGMPLDEIFAHVSDHSVAVRNNAGGYYNHWMFWTNLSPEPGEISGSLRTAIEEDFGSFEAFQDEFNLAAKTQFGSGWAWLIVLPGNHLAVVSTPNQDNPLMNVVPEQGIPILALDVWEHAYYLQYENRRGDYVSNFWEIIDWETVSERYEMALEGHVYNP